jgi:7,8-dihydro-6-hydroxymethylpterin-pyrophosphokinase
LVERAQQALEEAMQRVEKVKQWIRTLDRELMIYKAQCQPIARAVEAELPKAEGRLEQLRAQLEAYLQIRPEASGPRASTSRTPADETENAEES